MAEVLAEGGTATEQLYGIAARDLRLIGENKEFATVFFHEWRNLSEERQQRVIASRDRWEADLRSVFTRGIAGGEFRDIEPRIAGIVLTSIPTCPPTSWRGGSSTSSSTARAPEVHPPRTAATTASRPPGSSMALVSPRAVPATTTSRSRRRMILPVRVLGSAFVT
jgi:hypothetical protein